MSSSDEVEYTGTPPDMINGSQMNEMLPAKSKEKYEAAYNNFMKWTQQKNVNSFSENVLLTYFAELAKSYKPSTMWAVYSMLKATLKTKNSTDIEQYIKLRAFLKHKAVGFVGKQSKTLGPEHVEKFISEAPDDIYLPTKVALILGVMGGLRRQQLSDLTIDDITDFGEMYLIKTPHSNKKVPVTFVVTGEYYKIVKKYKELRTPKCTSPRFFQQYRNGKCTAQVIGKNTFGNMPREIAQFLNLEDANLYTGHSFRRTSEQLLAETRPDQVKLKRHRRSKSNTNTEEFNEESISNEIHINVPVKFEPRDEPTSPNIDNERTSPINEDEPSSPTLEDEPECKRPNIKTLNDEGDQFRDPLSSDSESVHEEINTEDSTTINITNMSRSITLPEKKLIINVSNNHDCYITLNFRK